MTNSFYQKNKDKIESLTIGGPSLCLGSRDAAHEIEKRESGIFWRTLYRYGKPTEWKKLTIKNNNTP